MQSPNWNAERLAIVAAYRAAGAGQSDDPVSEANALVQKNATLATTWGTFFKAIRGHVRQAQATGLTVTGGRLDPVKLRAAVARVADVLESLQ